MYLSTHLLESVIRVSEFIYREFTTVKQVAVVKDRIAGQNARLVER